LEKVNIKFAAQNPPKTSLAVSIPKSPDTVPLIRNCRAIGKVCKIVQQKSYGYIKLDFMDSDLWFHFSRVLYSAGLDLIVGDRVEVDMSLDASAQDDVKSDNVKSSGKQSYSRFDRLKAERVKVLSFAKRSALVLDIYLNSLNISDDSILFSTASSLPLWELLSRKKIGSHLVDSACRMLYLV
jgi:cold shock CspA family protein